MTGDEQCGSTPKSPLGFGELSRVDGVRGCLATCAIIWGIFGGLKRMRKLLNGLLFGLLYFVSTQSLHAETISVYPALIDRTTESSFEVRIDNAVDIIGFRFQISYDPAIIQLGTPSGLSDIFEDTGRSVFPEPIVDTSSPGKLTCTVFTIPRDGAPDDAGAYGENLTLATISFTMKQEEDATLLFNNDEVKISDRNGTISPVSVGGESALLYRITFTGTAGGSIEPPADAFIQTDGKVRVKHDGSQHFSITPDAENCYQTKDVLADRESVGPVSSHIFSNVNEDHTITAVFTDKYTVETIANEGCEITPSDGTEINCESDQTFTITPDECHKIANVLVDGVSVGAVDGYIFEDVRENHSIEAVCSTKSYSVEVVTGEDGNIEPSETVQVTCGSDQNFSIIPDTSYQILNVKLDEESVLTDVETDNEGTEVYLLENVSGDHKLEASFAKDKLCIITPLAGYGGQIEPSEPKTAECGTGEDTSFAITPDKCYEISDVLVDDTPVGAASSYTFDNVSDHHEIEAQFESILSCTIEVVQGKNGKIIDPEICKPGSQSYQIVPDDCYEIKNVIVDGNSVDAVNFYTFECDDFTDHTISAVFERTEYHVEAGADENCYINLRGNVPVYCGNDRSLIISCDESDKMNLIVDSLSDDNIREVENGYEYTFPNVREDHTIYVTTQAYTITVTTGENGKTEPSGEVSAGHGQDQIFTITPDACYGIKDIMMDGSSVMENVNMDESGVGTYTLEDVETDHAIGMEFEPANQAHIVRLVSGDGGDISLSDGTALDDGEVSVNCGEGVDFKITPDACYQIADIQLKGYSVMADPASDDSVYTLENVTEDQTLEVSFEKCLVGDIDTCPPDLVNVIFILQLLCDAKHDGISACSDFMDINGDGKTGLEDAIYILRFMVGMF